VLSNSGKPRRIESLPQKNDIFIDFLESIYKNKKPTLTQEEIFHVSDVIQAAEESSRSGRTVKI